MSVLTPLLTQGVDTMNEIVITICLDPNDQSWGYYSIGSAPGFSIQGAIGIAHEVGGVWMNVSGPGSAYIGCDTPTDVPADVKAAFDITCPSTTASPATTASPTTPSQPTTTISVPIPTTTTEPPTATTQPCPTGAVTSTITYSQAPGQGLAPGWFTYQISGDLENKSTATATDVQIYYTVTFSSGYSFSTSHSLNSDVAAGGSDPWSGGSGNYPGTVTNASVTNVSYSFVGNSTPGCGR